MFNLPSWLRAMLTPEAQDLAERAIVTSSVRVVHKRGDAVLMDKETKNLRTTVGFAAFADYLCGAVTPGVFGAATAVGATTLTDSGQTWTVNAYAGRRIITVNAAGLVYGNVLSNTATIMTVDGWKKFSDNTAATTPTGTPNYAVSGRSPGLYIAVTTDAGAAAAGDTTLASELAASGFTRALASAVSYNSGTKTLSIGTTFTATGTVTAIAKAGLFDAASAGTLLNEAVLGSTATVVTGDTLTVTWTHALS